ncbi:MAG TPA: hypothetical protein VK013_14850 [Myxococcaceae bacterium]|nr:hypothetical protein [Myxococcaceae bacterium]
MGRVMAAAMSVGLLGGGAVGTLGGLLGPWAEAAAVALVGVGLWTCGSLLGLKVRPEGPELRVPRQAS